MTHKRFKLLLSQLGNGMITDTQKRKDLYFDKVFLDVTLPKATEWLNALNEENEQLKERIKELQKESYGNLDGLNYYQEQNGHLSSKISDLECENEQLKKELKVYRKVASCSNCKYHNYDWNIDDGYGGEEYEVCDRGNDVTDGICEEWEEL